MINLLPHIAKKKLLDEYRLRAGVIIFCALFILEVFTVLALAPSYYLIDTAQKTLHTEIAAKKALVPVGEQDAQKQIAIIKAEMALLNPTQGLGDSAPSKILSDILAQKPVGIGINSFAYGRTSALIAVAQLSGSADTREDLLAFQRKLKDNVHFTDIKYAQSFITKKTDIDFQLTLTIK